VLTKLKSFSVRVAGRSCEPHVLILPHLLANDFTAIGRLKRVEIYRIPYLPPFKTVTKGSTLVSKSCNHSFNSPFTHIWVSVVSTILVNLEGFLLETTIIVRAVNIEKPAVSSTLQQLGSLLSTLLTPGLSEDIDYICRDKLHITASSASAGLARCANISHWP
jgi:hypothetical protein